MKDKTIDSIVDSLFRALPVIHRKLLKIDLEGASISRLHLAILGMLCESGPLPVSEIGKRLLISKPQMTPLVDRLISLGLVERSPDARDRRIIRVSVTGRGRKRLDECKALIGENLGRKLAVLTDVELKELSAALATLVEIGSRLE